MASLRDVADRAGVSLATASRVASGSSAVRPETKERVEGAMRDLLYVPPGRVEASNAIGLFVPDFSNPIFAALAEAMEMHASRSGLATILCNTHGSAGRERDYVRMLLERGVEGMLFISAEITDIRGRHSHYAKLLERGARLVFVNGGSEELDVTSVGVDERAAGTDRHRASRRARARAHRLRCGRRVRAPDTRESARAPRRSPGGSAHGRARRTLLVHRRRRTRGAA